MYRSTAMLERVEDQDRVVGDCLRAPSLLRFCRPAGSAVLKEARAGGANSAYIGRVAERIDERLFLCVRCPAGAEIPRVTRPRHADGSGQTQSVQAASGPRCRRVQPAAGRGAVPHSGTGSNAVDTSAGIWKPSGPVGTHTDGPPGAVARQTPLDRPC